MSYTVNVLTPRGRRQQVKVTANTTLLQVLEEVCNKHGFNAEEYDLRHHNKVLDISSMFRFTSLPNNAQLEMTEATKLRQETPVTLGLQFESGERLTGVYSPSDSIWDVIVNLKPEEEKKRNLVVIYMRQEIYGKENLRMTTLRSLGLTSGRAMLRILHRSPEELKIQANVSANLPTRVALTEKPEQKERVKSPEPFKRQPAAENPKVPSPESAKKETPKYQKADITNLRGNIFEKLLRDDKVKKSLEARKNTETSDTLSSKKETIIEETKKKSSPDNKVKTGGIFSKSMKKGEMESDNDKKVILLGERNAVAYNLNSVEPAESDEEPDDFYDLTINDAKLLLKQAKQLCQDLEEAPLMTSAQRELEKDKKVLTLLNQYKKTVLRVKFPDRTVLQGTFSPVETVSAVEKFVSEYLEKPKLKFYLYTTPPKVILKPEERLIECGCVPCSILYFGMPPDVKPPSQYLKSDVMRQLSSLSAAALTALESRGMNEKKKEKVIWEEGEKRKWSTNSTDSEPGTSGSTQWENRPNDQENSPQFKVPKWFKNK